MAGGGRGSFILATSAIHLITVVPACLLGLTQAKVALNSLIHPSIHGSLRSDQWPFTGYAITVYFCPLVERWGVEITSVGFYFLKLSETHTLVHFWFNIQQKLSDTGSVFQFKQCLEIKRCIAKQELTNKTDQSTMRVILSPRPELPIQMNWF